MQSIRLFVHWFDSTMLCHAHSNCAMYAVCGCTLLTAIFHQIFARANSSQVMSNSSRYFLIQVAIFALTS